MWRSALSLIKQNVSPAAVAAVTRGGRTSSCFPSRSLAVLKFGGGHCFSSYSSPEQEDNVSSAEAQNLMRLVNVEALKKKLGAENQEAIAYADLIDSCQRVGFAKSVNEAASFARILDDAGVVLIFKDRVYLHPEKVVKLIGKAVPLALSPEDDPRRTELKMLQEKKEEIDIAALKQVRLILWTGLGSIMTQVGVFFRLTYWEFSWDVMEPVAFFTTATSLVIGYAYFCYTSRDPTYQDFKKRLFLSRQRKLFKKRNFDVNRLIELQAQCKCPHDVISSVKRPAIPNSSA